MKKVTKASISNDEIEFKRLYALAGSSEIPQEERQAYMREARDLESKIYYDKKWLANGCIVHNGKRVLESVPTMDGSPSTARIVIND